MNKQTYIKPFADYNKAFSWMTMKNKAFEKAGNKKDSVCVVPGPDNDYAVVDLLTGIELGLGYVWTYGGWIENPFNVI